MNKIVLNTCTPTNELIFFFIPIVDRSKETAVNGRLVHQHRILLIVTGITLFEKKKNY